KNYYLIPLVSKMLDCLFYLKVFIKLNLCNAYYRLCIKKRNNITISIKIRNKSIIINCLTTNYAITLIYVTLNIEYLNIFIIAYIDNILVFSKHNKDY
ncbi:hypothetical protein K458DRAFT_288589, partial [Lentithecium fluviatile CBS 122367]